MKTIEDLINWALTNNLSVWVVPAEPLFSDGVTFMVKDRALNRGITRTISMYDIQNSKGDVIEATINEISYLLELNKSPAERKINKLLTEITPDRVEYEDPKAKLNAIYGARGGFTHA